jgi:hypothetical protein
MFEELELKSIHLKSLPIRQKKKKKKKSKVDAFGRFNILQSEKASGLL